MTSGQFHKDLAILQMYAETRGAHFIPVSHLEEPIASIEAISRLATGASHFQLYPPSAA